MFGFINHKFLKMKKISMLLFFLFYANSFSQIKQLNGSVYKDGGYVNSVRSLMSTYKTNDISKIKKAYKKISSDNIIFRDPLNNMDGQNPFGVSISLENEMENMGGFLKSYELLSIEEVGYPDHLDYKENNDLVISWWNINWRNKSSGNEKITHLMVGHHFNQNGKIISETYYFNSSGLPK